jgi:hypothetical protein
LGRFPASEVTCRNDACQKCPADQKERRGPTHAKQQLLLSCMLMDASKFNEMPPFCRSEFAGTSHQEGRLLWVGRTSADAADHRVPVHQKQAWVRICCFSNVVILFRTFPARNAGTGPPTCWLPVAVTRALWVTTPQGLHELDRVLVVRLVRLIRYQRRFVRGNAACVSSRAGLFEQAQHIAVALLPAAADPRVTRTL